MDNIKVGMRLTTQKESGSRFDTGDIVYASINLKTVKQFKIKYIFELSDGLIWYSLEPTQMLPEGRVFKTKSECRNDLIKRYNGI